ncbi:MAG: beta-ketoacyl synthase N-terminal-like domain-containing protein [Vicinamibacteria bacterium]
MSFPPIAIVGQSCLLPGARRPEDLVQAVLAGRDLLSATPEGRWRLPKARLLDAPAASLDRVACDRGGYVESPDEPFDANGLQVPAADLAGLDPLFLWTLRTAREALGAAGLPRAPERCGLVMGNLSFPSGALAQYAEAVWRAGEADAPALPDPRNRFMSGLPALLAARALGLRGPAFALDAACASSFYALKLACDALHDGRADLMLAGAVNRADDLFIHVGFTALRALSPSGRSRPFHRDADGLVPAEGAAFVALKRLADAVADGDTVLGVVRGIGLSNDGRGAGLLAPSEEGQRRALAAAYESAGLRPGDVSLLECHATGTPVGDATEVRSTGAIFAGCKDVPIGSIKSNLGHLITVAGMAGLLKVLGAFRAGVRPPTLHADQPLDALAGSPFRLLAEPEPWTSAGPRRAGLSAFGFGGNNAHVIVEEWTGPEQARARAAVALAPPATRPPAEGIAIVGLGVVAHQAPDSEAFARRLLQAPDHAEAGASRLVDAIELDAEFLRFPPADLRAALPQQLLLLDAARQAARQAGALPRERTAVLVGMQCDAEVARYGARWRNPGAGDAFVAALHAPGVVGTMPNISANRLNSQFDLAGPSLTVSAEELSGVVGLELAARALRSGEIDAALVGAVDACAEPVHAHAAERVLPGAAAPGDAAVVLALKRLEDARREGLAVLAVLEPAAERADGRWLDLAAGAQASRAFGHAHAASGLLAVAAALASIERAARPASEGALPWLSAEARRARVLVGSFAGPAREVCLSAVDGGLARGFGAPPRIHSFAARDRAELVAALEAGREGGEGPCRAAVIASGEDELRAGIAEARARLRDAAAPEGSEDVFVEPEPVAGELAFVFAGPAGAYHGMGRELLLALPELHERLAQRSRSLPGVAGWIYGGSEPAAVDKLWGASFLSQAHVELSRGILGLAPQAAIGFCSGETNALYAMGAWRDLDGIVADIEAAGVYERELAGELRAVRRHRGIPASAPLRWASSRVLAPEQRLREALAREPGASLTIVNAPGDFVIGGDAESVARVVESIGPQRCRPLGYDIAVHAPELRAFETEWRRIHTRETFPVPDVRFYSHAFGGSYDVTRESAAEAIFRQACGTVDFPTLVRRAWDDGVRVFLEHGPRDSCSRWISRSLGERPHRALALDVAGAPSLRQAARAAAALWAAGTGVDLARFQRALEALAPAGAEGGEQRRLRFAGHWPAVALAPAAAPPVATAPSVLASAALPAPPALPPILGWAAAERDLAHVPASAADAPDAPQQTVPASAPAAEPTRALPAAAVSLIEHHARVARAHAAYLAQMAESHRRFLDLRAGSRAGLAAELQPMEAANGASTPRTLTVAAAAVEPPPAAPLTPRPAAAAPDQGEAPSGRSFTRAELEVHASGRISSIFGSGFEGQDGFVRQVRMPEPPLLLADRVTGLRGEPGSLGLGSVWTETDVARDAWYLHEGRMPAGIMIESGQADLLLISWLGVDARNRGERVYRLLGCDLTYHGGLPRPGDTLRYDIHVDAHAAQGEVRLFFFHYDCRVAGERRLSVRNGQAGFFTDEELRDSGGVLWDPSAEDPASFGPHAPAPAASSRSAFDREAVEAFARGDAFACFGDTHALARTHVRSPRIAQGRMLLMGEVAEWRPDGGPWGRGYLRSVRRLGADDWFYAGHFKNDPCMPGTLMFEGCLQTMAFHLAAAGFTLACDGWRFEPVPDESYRLRCRGQAIPSSRELVYEVFVRELVAGPEPTLYADLLCSVDGVKAFHCRRMGLRLAPDHPLARAEAPPPDRAPERAAVASGVRLDQQAMLACAWGRPSEALGPAYAPFDGPRRMPRLPGPPYHFLSRVTRIEGEIGSLGPGARIEVEYDLPRDAWYFAEGAGVMPFSVLLEANLQPCGWLALATGVPLRSEEELRFRNLDGEGAVRRHVRPEDGRLRTRVRLKDVSRSAGMALVSFQVESFVGDEPVFAFETGFGFFPREALARQVGLPTNDAEREQLREASAVEPPDWNALVEQHPRALPRGRLLMPDRFTGYWPDGGEAGLGRWRAEKDVRLDEWFLKAHFFQDPVQPGSLGLEALLQLLRAAAIGKGLSEGLEDPWFEPIALDRPLVWRYRGQVTPESRLVQYGLELRALGEDGLGRLAVGDGWLAVDGTRIYSARGLAIRVRDLGGQRSSRQR